MIEFLGRNFLYAVVRHLKSGVVDENINFAEFIHRLLNGIPFYEQQLFPAFGTSLPSVGASRAWSGSCNGSRKVVGRQASANRRLPVAGLLTGNLVTLGSPRVPR